ncbi:laccase domain-containing protein [Luteolibacter yonseiensis]|uniref:laccase domain-containing protein n=1 Tax=Luteolibacter yonseiensis TaxID=1144680 RepID=UPI0031F05487
MTEAFPFLNPLNSIPGVRAGWIERVPDLPITGDRDEAMRLLRPHHEEFVRNFAGPDAGWWRAEQVHGTDVAAVPGSPQVTAPDGLPVVPGVDGLITCQPGIVMAIYNADCGAIWLADRKSGAIGLLHSGKKGTEGNILQVALDEMAARYGTRPADVVAVLSPCIRPPDYEVDIPAGIGAQAERAGIGEFLDCGLNTAADLSRFYSYRKELGKTGRMMALITKDIPA